MRSVLKAKEMSECPNATFRKRVVEKFVSETW